VGVALIAGIVAGPGLYGEATAGSRLDPSLQHAQGSVNVRVLLGFQPQGFNQTKLTSYGVFAGRNGNSVILLHVPAERLHDLASIYWVSKIEPLTSRR
jgi:hypothetical protein